MMSFPDLTIRLPEKINPCPILEAIVEIRFDSKVPHEAIFGIIYAIHTIDEGVDVIKAIEDK